MKKILIMDDSPLVHQIYGTQLSEAGYHVVSSTDSLQTINLAFTEMPDLIMLDIHMPQINGYQVCRLLKDHPLTRDIPIIIITGAGEKGIVQNPKKWSFETGADYYFDKNESADLLKIVETLAGRLDRHRPERRLHKPMNESEILTAISNLLDKQLYLDVTRLKELDEKKDAFVSNVSHELKSPLHIIGGFLENLKDGVHGPVGEEQLHVIGICTKTVDRLYRLIRDLLDISKIQAGKMKLEKAEVNLADLLGEVGHSFEWEAQKKAIVISKESAPVRAVFADKDRITQVLVNVISNSIKYTPKGGQVLLTLREGEEGVHFEVKDNGPGIKKEDLEKIFDKFERVTAESQEGTGLGLPIARDIVELHGGKIWAESEYGKGTTFHIVLPPAVKKAAGKNAA